MKFLIVIALSICYLHYSVGTSFPVRLGLGIHEALQNPHYYTHRYLEKEINYTMQCFRMVLAEGLPEHNIPSFSPLELDGFSLDLTSLGIPGATGYFNAENIRVEGLMDFLTPHIKGKLIILGGIGFELEITVQFPTLHLGMDYDADVEVSEIKVHGDGDVTLDLTEFQIALDVKILLDTKTSSNSNRATGITIDTMNILPSVENVTVKFTGLFNSEEQSELVNKILNTVLTNWVNEKAQEISDLITGIIKDLINNIPPSGLTATTEEPEEPEEPNIIDIIFARCEEIIGNPTTTEKPPTTPSTEEPPTTPSTEEPPTTPSTEEPPTTPSTEKPPSTEEPPVTDDPILAEIKRIVEEIENMIDELQKELQAGNKPIEILDLPITGILNLIGIEGNWVFDQILLKDYYNWKREDSEISPIEKPTIGKGVEIRMPFYWENDISLEIDQNGEVKIGAAVLKSENSKITGTLRGFRFTIIVGLYADEKFEITLLPDIDADDNAAIVVTGITLNGDAINHLIEQFVNKELVPFLSKHNHDMGDIFGGLCMMVNNIILKILNWQSIDIDSFRTMDTSVLFDSVKELVQTGINLKP